MTNRDPRVTTDVTVSDENVVDTEVEVERTDKDVEVQTGGLAVDVEREGEPDDEEAGDADPSV